MIELYQSNEKKKKYNKKSFPDGRILRKFDMSIIIK